MNLEWLWGGLYFVCACFLFLALKNIPRLRFLSWKTPFRASKICLYSIISSIFFLVSSELSSFYASEEKQALLEVKIAKIEDQHFQLELIIPSDDRSIQSFKVYGDMWQADMKILTWNTLFTYFGAEPLYSLERLNGRYTKLDDEFNKKRSIHSIQGHEEKDISWPYVLKIIELVFVRSFYGSAVFAPMENNAKFSIYLTDTGIELLPSNDEASYALKNWK